jgi:hypothetical protein
MVPPKHGFTPFALSCYSYFTPKEGDEAYDQQCDVILKFEYL